MTNPRKAQLKLTQEKIENLSRPTPSKEIQSVIKKKKCPQRKSQSWMASLMNSKTFKFYQHLRRITILHKQLKKIEEEGALFKLFH